MILDDDIKGQVEKRFTAFKQAMTLSINILSIDNMLETPDYILAQYLYDCLTVYGMAIASTNKHKQGITK